QGHVGRNGSHRAHGYCLHHHHHHRIHALLLLAAGSEHKRAKNKETKETKGGYSGFLRHVSYSVCCRGYSYVHTDPTYMDGSFIRLPATRIQLLRKDSAKGSR